MTKPSTITRPHMYYVIHSESEPTYAEISSYWMPLEFVTFGSETPDMAIFKCDKFIARPSEYDLDIFDT